MGNVGSALKAIDYQTGKVRWSHPLAMTANGSTGGAMGLLSTAGGLLFGNDGGSNFVAYDPLNGKPLWHAGLGVNTSNGPQTYLLDGRQFVVVGVGDARSRRQARRSDCGRRLRKRTTMGGHGDRTCLPRR